MEKNYFDDYEVGERFVSPGRTMTETDIHQFAALTGDWHPLHTNVEYAKETVFGERIVHGFLSLVVGSALIFRLGAYVTMPKSFIAFCGMDEVRFTAPVKIGDTIFCECEVTGLIAKDKRKGVIVIQNRIKNQRDEEVIVYSTSALAGRAPASMLSA